VREAKDGDHALARLELVRAGRELLRAAAAEVVDPVVAVGRVAELAEPAVHELARRVDVHGAHQDLLRVRDEVVARKRLGAFLSCRSPALDGVA